MNLIREEIESMFPNFEFSALDDPTFKEDAVREEIIAPILRRAGYRATGPLRVQRSQTLKHPFVMIGSKKHPVTIIPDYTLFHNDRMLMILDAKRPSEGIVNSVNVEQAYSYAIHPDVRCKVYGLCNDRQLSLFHTERYKPILVIDTSEINERWEDVSKLFSPAVLETPEIIDFHPDFGLHANKAGIPEGTLLSFVGYHLQLVQKLDQHFWTVTSTCSVNEREYMISFDMDDYALDKVLLGLPVEHRIRVREALNRGPFQADLEAQVIIDCSTLLGPKTKGSHEIFAPFRVVNVLSSRYDSTVVKTPHPDGLPPDTPSWVFRLSKH
ncbi:MAG TPA: hypothetical protein VF865_16935 [Acidobacteriaceae bacterium]